MSNFYPTIGRPVQYIDREGRTHAAVITDIYPNNQVELAVITAGLFEGITRVNDANAYTIGARASENVNVYLLNWQGR